MNPIRKNTAFTAMCLALAALLAPALASATPSNVLFEGALRSTTGGPAADGDYDLTFSLYDDAQAQSAFWSETTKVKVSGGQFSHALGSVKALDASTLAGKAAPVIGVTVGTDPELPRQPLQAVAYALHAATASVAGGLSCSACVTVGALKFDDNVDLGSNGLKAGNITATKLTAQDVAAQTVTAASYVGDGSKLTGIKTPAGKCDSGKVVAGINADGTLDCVSTAGALPKDGLNEISNDMLTTQFVESFAMPDGEKGLAIPDNTGIEAISTITVGDVGTAEAFFKVNVDLINSDLSQVSIVLLPPDDKKTGYVLCDPCGASGEKTLKTSFPDPTKTKTGDLTSWLGKNPKGLWNLKVKDTNYCIPQAPGNQGLCDVIKVTDGKINDWSITFQVLSNSKVQAAGDMLVTGSLKAQGGVMVGGSSAPCDATREGMFRWNASGKQAEVCDGSAWTSLAPPSANGAIYRWVVWNTYWYWSTGWFSGNDANLYGGVAPSNWSNNYHASHMSSSSNVLRGFFHRKGPSIVAKPTNSVVLTEEGAFQGNNGSSSPSKHVAALFRVKNTTSSNIVWKLYYYCTAYGGWSDRCSVALNGANIWDSGGNNYHGSSSFSVDLTIPANRTSTVIVVSSSSPQASYSQSLNLAFYNNSLKLPTGLEYVDDLDTKPDGWDK